MHPRRTPFVGGNWKMNTTLASAVELTEDVAAAVKELEARCDIAIFPPFPYLQAVGHALGHHWISLGAQDVWHKPDGAFTGEVSVDMLTDLGARAVIVGHSERRHVIGEDDDLVNLKLRAALAGDLTAVLCVGETWPQREAGTTDETNLRQLDAALQQVEESALPRLVIAYEPVWAIGTGKTASPADAQAAHHTLRRRLAERWSERAAASIRIVYGGSVHAQNAAELFAQPDIDGGLIGGASLKAADFAAICRAAAG
jgi:triosephosphate isomerase